MLKPIRPHRRSKQAEDESLLNVEVLDVAQLLLVRRPEEDVVTEAEARSPRPLPTKPHAAGDELQDAEPGPEAQADPGTLTDTESVGAAADAHESADADRRGRRPRQPGG